MISSSNIKRFYSNLTEYNNSSLNPVKKYDDFKQDRSDILKEQKNKAGIYYLINNVNGNAYVGSSIYLASRMRNYLNTSFLESRKNKNMPIVMALLKYGHSNFSL
jgi:hypothetical protein